MLFIFSLYALSPTAWHLKRDPLWTIELGEMRDRAGLANHDRGRTGRRRNECEALFVQKEALAGVDDDVAGIVRLSDPHSPLDAGHCETFAVVDIEQGVMRELN
jgi:hypothetical protein